MHQLTPVGDEQRAGCVLVQPTNGGDGWVALEPARRQEVEDAGPLAFVMRADVAGGLVQENENSLWRIHRLAIHLHVGRARLLVHRLRPLAVD